MSKNIIDSIDYHKDFNSIKVQLECVRASCIFCFACYFNSIKVQLEFHGVLLLTLMIVNFNSIKVQLESLASYLSSYSDIFQFHKGSIRMLLNNTLTREKAIFQFHKGSIRIMNRFFTILFAAYFNSIKVQLE